MNHDTYLTSFRRFLSEGMSHEEAVNQFDPELLEAAIRSELDLGTGVWPLFDLVVKANWERRNRKDWEEQAVPLMLAGWAIEQPDGHKHNSKDFWRQPQAMSLYWRRPSRRPGKPGRRYLSTNQAYMAMQKETQSSQVLTRGGNE